MADSKRTPYKKQDAFTLIELLVVISIIALLIGILLPSLSSARKSAQAIITASNARNVAQAATIYTGNNRAYLPPSYVYANSKTGFDWDVEDQKNDHPSEINGYIHWSYSLFDNGEIPLDAFESPAVRSRGAPRTNPGKDINDWEPEQVNAEANGPGGDWPEDRQVPRLAFAANAALMPRNKFNPSGTQRKAKLVREHVVNRAANTILFTEFRDTANWRSLADPIGTDGDGGNENIIKSHRPITPFFGLSSGSNVFMEPTRFNLPRFAYPDVEQLADVLNTITYEQTGLIVGNGGSGSSLEAVGNTFDGKANFAFLDGHVELSDVVETVRRRQWGERFYSITGNNELVEPREP